MHKGRINRNVKLSRAIWEWIDVVLLEARDKTEEEERGDLLLVINGWGDPCVEPVWDDARPVDENEAAAREYAEQQSGKLIDEWIDIHRRTHKLGTCGHVTYPMHGVTWALFKTRVKDQAGSKAPSRE